MLTDIQGYPVEQTISGVVTNIQTSHLGYSTNNIYLGFPPMTNDGRNVVATHQPESILNSILIQQNNIQSNWEYRQYLIKNANSIIKQNFDEASTDVGYMERCTPSEMHGDKPISNKPFMYGSYQDNAHPQGYVNSDLKDIYLSREQLNARKFAPSITQYEFLQSHQLQNIHM